MRVVGTVRESATEGRFQYESLHLVTDRCKLFEVYHLLPHESRVKLFRLIGCTLKEADQHVVWVGLSFRLGYVAVVAALLSQVTHAA